MAHGWVTLVSPGHALGIVKYVDPQNPPNLLNQDLQFHKCARSSVCVCVHAHVCIPLLKYVRLLQLYGLQPTRFLCPWNFLGKSTGMGCLFLLWEIFPEVQRYFEICHSWVFCVRKANKVAVSKHFS